jgi:hypothetical protein
MGKITDLITKIRERDNASLMDRFKQVLTAQAIRAYISSKPNPDLDIEVRLTEEEIMNRILSKSYAVTRTHVTIKEEDKEEEK